MKFLYEYRTSDNVLRCGEINAASKDVCYSLLKEKGIKPSRVEEAPGVLNKLLGKGKRWMAILILTMLCFVLSITAWMLFREVKELTVYEERSQIYGDPVVIKGAIKEGWSSAFSDKGDQWLSCHAIPAAKCGCEERNDLEEVANALLVGKQNQVKVEENDLREIAQMKKMVNGLKNEMNRYLKAGGTIEKYMGRLCVRQKAEQGMYEKTRMQILQSSDPEVWAELNKRLRAMGLPMVDDSGEE